jgi:ubiquinone/menaquinone biosynthesis C-methylase UbiE
VPSFDAQASTFDARAGLPDDVRIAIAEAIVDIGEVRQAGRLLEVGAGTGLVGEHLARNLPPVIPGGAPRYLGIDVSPPMLREFLNRTKNDSTVWAQLQFADANGTWTMDDQSIRVVYGARVFHLLNTEHLVTEVRRVGAPPFVTVVAGRIRRNPEGIFAQMRRALHKAMRARGHEPRRGDEHIETLVDAFLKIGGKRLKDRVVAKWSQPSSPARSLAAWRAKEGLGGLDLAAAEQASILREVEIWAANEYPNLDVEEPSAVEFVLHAVRLEVKGHDDPGGGGHHGPTRAARRGKAKRR